MGDRGRKCPDLWRSVADYCSLLHHGSWPADRKGESVGEAVNHRPTVAHTHTHTVTQRTHIRPQADCIGRETPCWQDRDVAKEFQGSPPPPLYFGIETSKLFFLDSDNAFVSLKVNWKNKSKWKKKQNIVIHCMNTKVHRMFLRVFAKVKKIYIYFSAPGTTSVRAAWFVYNGCSRFSECLKYSLKFEQNENSK